MRKFIAAAAIAAAAAAASLFGFAGHASANTLSVSASASPAGACLTVSWSFDDPSEMLPVAVPVGLPIPFAGSETHCLPGDLPNPGVPNPELPPVPGV